MLDVGCSAAIDVTWALCVCDVIASMCAPLFDVAVMRMCVAVLIIGVIIGFSAKMIDANHKIT